MSELQGTGSLLRFALARDVRRTVAWALGLASLLAATASSFSALYATVDERVAFGQTAGANATLRALYGPLFDARTVGGLTAWRTGWNLALFAGLMSLLQVVRHTRAEEESGRAELLGALAVGRRAPLVAALVAVWAADLAVGVVLFLVALALGLPFAGSAVLGSVTALTAAVFATVGAVTAQLTRSGRGASGLAGAVLAASYLLRAVGDVRGSWVSWLSPLAWPGRARAYAGDRWPVLVLPLVLCVVLVAGAAELAGRRDLGAGMLPERSGPATASGALRVGLVGLAARLARPAALGWVAGAVAIGALVGGLAADVGRFVGTNQSLADAVRRLGGAQGLVDAYVGTTLAMLGMLAAAAAVQAVLRIAAEEEAGRAELLLAGPTSRRRWAIANMGIAAAMAVTTIASAGAVLGVVHGIRSHAVAHQLGRVLLSALGQAPGAVLCAAVAYAVLAAWPRRTGVVWSAFAVAVLLDFVGPMVPSIPSWVLDLEPFHHGSRVPATADGSVGALVMAVTAFVVFVVGTVVIGRRELRT